ncbi:unnamed protein product [Psylliodes chrysocephalus]|uniref:Nicastrin n=1 Tax=Psylliodes chrysocephalus TaxID=3402493 RepID=A0A9P0GI61_9CUCU|nr:unnamed protein product [Psylliodes chrysocephala]
MNTIKQNILVFNILFLLQFPINSYGDRTKDKMYEEISSSNACFRRLNGTHQIGCSSKRGGSTGVIHFCETEKDLEDIIVQGTGYPYIPILPFKLFNHAALHLMIDSNKISGLILHTNNEPVDVIKNFTHENQCPNPYSSIDGTCKKESVWNPWGTGLLYFDIPFPIFYVERTEDVGLIRECFVKFNNYSYQEHADRSLCSLELNSFMYATTNSPTCIRRSSIVSNLNPQKFCDPLGDSNVWASLHPLAEGPKKNETKPIKDYKYIVIAARLDTTSLFEKTSGASSPITGIVTLLSLAKYLNDTVRLEDVKAGKKNVLFFLFNGETYDYIGSQRMLYDMLNGNFPIPNANDTDILPAIGPEDIDLFVEISQLGNINQKLYVHYLNDGKVVNNFVNKLTNTSSPVPFEAVPNSLPPASLHTFLKNSSSFPGLVISDHKTFYSNHFYNSVYDNSSNIHFKYYNLTTEEISVIPKDSIQYFIKNITEIIGRSIYQEITGHGYTGDSKVDLILVNELLYCYLEDPNCKVHQAVHKDLNLPKIPLALYVGVKGQEHNARILTSLTLGWFTGKTVGQGNINCTNKFRSYAFKYYNMSKSIYDLNVTMCYQVTMNATEAVSPAFSIKDYDWSSGQYSSWTESTWKELNVRLFLKPSANQGKMTMAIGCISMIFSFLLVYFIKSRSHILFVPPIPTDAPTDC